MWALGCEKAKRMMAKKDQPTKTRDGRKKKRE